MTRSIPAPILMMLGLALLACEKNRPVETEVSIVAPLASAYDGEVPEASPPPGESTDGGAYKWFTTCGAPVCRGYSGPWPGVPACGDAKQGKSCGSLGATCDFESNCNARLVCAVEDPKARPGGCPISRARFKTDIDYLDAAEIAAYYREAQDLKLATFRYRARSDEELQLGVILEDGEDRERAVWADSANDRVNLYGYASLALAGVQAQARELAALRAELDELREELSELRRRGSSCASR